MASCQSHDQADIDCGIDDFDACSAADLTSTLFASSSSSSSAAAAAVVTLKTGLSAPVRGQKSIPNAALGDRRNLQDIAHVAFGIAVERGGAMRAAINSGRVRFDGEIHRKANRFFHSKPGSLIELLEPEPFANAGDCVSATAACLGADAADAGAGALDDNHAVTRPAHKLMSESDVTGRADRMDALHAALGKISVPPALAPVPIGGRRVVASSVVRATTLMMNKPHECVTAMSDARHTTVMGMPLLARSFLFSFSLPCLPLTFCALLALFENQTGCAARPSTAPRWTATCALLDGSITTRLVYCSLLTMATCTGAR